MPLFRVILPLDKGGHTIYPGSFTRLEWLQESQQQVLVDVGAVSEVVAPPLAILPGWTTRAARLMEAGIEDVVQFLDADDDTLCAALKRKKETVATYRNELYRWLTADAPAAG